jgi:SAM-dependent methyltransferase
MLNDGERQVAETVAGIRADHRHRYEFAARALSPGSRVVDLACGVGYGSCILAEVGGHTVLGIDRSIEAISFARRYYHHANVVYHCEDAADAKLDGEFDAAVCFETIEHIEDPAPLLRKLREAAPVLYASVPNEDEFPYGRGVKFHYRHYTQAQFDALLASCGWRVKTWLGQRNQISDVTVGAGGRTILAVCERAEEIGTYTPDRETYEAMQRDMGVPEHVAILGLGPSLEQYVDMVKRLGGKHAFCNEVWGLNAVGGVIMCDRVFHMDDVRIQEVRAKAQPESNIARMLQWMRMHPGPIITSRAHPNYPGLVEYPLQDVITDLNVAYFNSTAAYAVAFAIHIGVKKISLFGCDYTYPNAHQAERGRANVEYFLGMANARGIKTDVPRTTSLLDALHTQEERLYGYDSLAVSIEERKGKAHVEFRPIASLPSAAEMEARYDHTAHPNPLVKS